MPEVTPNVSSVRSRDGLALHVVQWPAPTDARGAIHLVHGLGEHIGRYAHVASHLIARGWRVTGHDHRGHGRSEGRRGGIRTADDMLDDLARVLDAVGDGPRPRLLLGHSMGALLVAQFVAQARRPVDGAVLTSPPFDAGLSAFQRAQLAVGLALVPDLPMGNQLDATKIAHDDEVVRRYRTDPLVHDRVTARLAKALVDGGRAMLDAAPRWRTPTLLMWAGDDRLVQPRGSEAFAARAPHDVVTTRCFPDLWHEILNEPAAAPVFAELDAWLASRPPVPTAPR